ncbi:MAG: DNA gyrase C-terminal beta-propeller domain-containing protein, partial [Acutalibacteraceae bacterium]|nr:DNA gyrase C-terminal beta-propeller domain-containing protein [Acutalibacteraceae bacterium]
GVVIRIPMDSISVFNRPAKGVRVMKVNEGAKLITAAVTDKVEETPDEPDDAENAENAVDNGGAQVSDGEVIAEHGVEEARDALLEAADKPMDITDGEADE